MIVELPRELLSAITEGMCRRTKLSKEFYFLQNI